ncbi:MAG: hypothetical protein AAFN70_21130, partial [Planctomycetota bacterium]
MLFADDEKWDAADLENMFLAWQPSNARNITGNTIHRDAATNAPEILPNRLIGQQIVPSFHRPALFNYLANAPIHLFPNDPNAKPLALLDPADPTGEDQQRFIRLVQRVRAACLRPLPFEHRTVPGNVNYAAGDDLDGDGEFNDGNPLFSGSNPSSVLNSTFQIEALSVPSRTRLIRLLRWLANGPWNVDNDDDLIPDSIWTDFKLSTYETADGTTIRPMVALLIEDMDGKVNINVTGNQGQMTEDFFDLGAAGTAFNDDVTFRRIHRGSGVGPAEIHLGSVIGFDPRTAQRSTLGLNAFNYPFFLDFAYGRLLQRRYGGISNAVG